MPTFTGWAAAKPGEPLRPHSYDPGPMKPDDVELEVLSCGVCHSDLSIINNDWGVSGYPVIPGHEVVGRVAARGDAVEHLDVGDVVGLGWFSRSDLVCPHCMRGDHNLCPSNEQTIVGRHGGFADRVRCQAAWAVKVPDGVDAAKAGPLFCGGITVFNPIVQLGVRPTDRVAVVGIGGLGHLALQFLRAWGCHVTALTSTDAKADEAKALGAHEVINSRDTAQLERAAGAFDFILVTVNVPLEWGSYIASLAPRGRLHFVGAVLEPIELEAFALILGQRSVSGTPLGSPATSAVMLDFCARHGIAPVTETFPMDRANDAIEHLRAGNARYRVVLTN